MFVRRIVLLAASVALAAPLQANANYACAGTLSYLGMDGTGNLTLALSGSTPIHAICNVNAQDGWGFTVGACKAVYASLLAARLTGKGVTVYYHENGLTCSTLPSWGAAPAYHIEGPN